MRAFKIIFTIFFLAALVGGAVFVVGLWNFRKEALYSGGQIYENAQLAADALKSLETQKARDAFQRAREELNLLFVKSSFWSQFFPLIKEVPKLVTKATDITTTSIELTDDIELLKNNGVQLIIQKRGDELVAILSRLYRNVSHIITQTDNDPVFKETTQLPVEKLYLAKNALAALISWLDDSEPQNLLLLFQNPSEIRPAGGFLGSYAHLTLIKGGLANLEVTDIYDPDGQLTVKIVPPAELQSITPNWGARDANWFFDYPTSARKVIEMLEASRIYQDRKINFSGAIAINVRVIEDILRLIGPLNIGELTLGADNFLTEVQEEVETKQSKGILQKITPLIFQRLNRLTDKQKKDLVNIISQRIANKDIMFYFHNPILENFIKFLGADGGWFSLSSDFQGDYLAIANANVAGGKTDAFIKQKTKLVSQIDRSGNIHNFLTITRTHEGHGREEKWYNTINQNFVQIFTPRNTQLVKIDGAAEKKITPLVNYEKGGYKIDHDLSAPLADKNTISSWFYVKPGETNQLAVEYERPGALNPKPSESEHLKYQFVFDKQSGVDGILEITILAPEGFIWQESNKEVFEYYTDNSPARLLLNLNLIKK